jgi:hypothetical protein
VEFGNAHTPAEILATFETIPNDHVRKGISKLITTMVALLDHVVHEQAAVLAYNHIFVLVAASFLLVGPLVLLLPRSARVQGERELLLDA